MSRLTRCEELHHATGGAKTAVLLALRDWLAYRAGGNQAYLVRAHDAAAAGMARDGCDYAPAFTRLFLLIEMGYDREAKALLNGLKARRGWLRARSPQGYAHLCALEGLLNIRRYPGRAVYKWTDELARIEGLGAAEADTLAGALYARAGADEDAFASLQAAYDAGGRGVFLFMALHDLYENAEACKAGDGLLAPFLSWAMARGFDVSRVAARWRLRLSALLRDDAATAEALYAHSPQDWLLQTICRRLFAEGDVSRRALYYYREAEAKQLSFPGLNGFLARAAYENNVTDIGRFQVAQFLRAEPTGDILRFFYEILLTDERCADLLAARRGEAFRFAVSLMAEGDATPILCQLIVEAAGEFDVDPPVLARAAEIVWQNLFVYEITVQNPKVRHVWVTEPDLRQGRLFDLSGGKAYVSAARPDFAAWYFGEKTRGVMTPAQAGASAKRVLPRAGLPLIERFFAQGRYCAEMAACLADAYAEAADEAGLPLLSRAAEDAALSPATRNRARAALGAYYAERDAALAAAYYGGVDENQLTGAAAEHMLAMFTRTGRFDRAVGLLLKKSAYIGDRAAFRAVTQILSVNPDAAADLADAAYELLLKHQYDRRLLELILARYHGPQDDWLALNAALAEMNAEDPRVDERVLANAIFIRRPDAHAQALFARVAARTPDAPLVKDFSDYMAYEILVGGMKPAFDVVETLERRFLAMGDDLAAYALAHVYIGHNITSAHSADITRAAARLAERDGFLFPVFKRQKDKSLTTPYIERNAAFRYLARAGGACDLFYRFDGDERFAKRPMRRARFGLWFAHLPLFYGETAEYYIRETTETGSAQTPRATVANHDMPRPEDRADAYDLLNGASLCEQMFQYDRAEERIGKLLAERPPVVAELM